jgi:hypothetical protein
MAADPEVKLLTDVGVIAVRQGDRAPFVDPWLFRMLEATDRIRVDSHVRRVADRDYDWIISSANLDDPASLFNPFALPLPLIEAARGRYRRVGGLADRGPGTGIHVHQPIDAHGMDLEARGTHRP